MVRTEINTPDRPDVRPAGAPPGPRGPAILLSRLHAFADYLGFLERTAGRYGEVVRLDATTLLVSGPEQIEHVLVRAHRIFQKEYDELREARSLWGNGLAVNNDDSWLTHRRMIQAAFGEGALARYACVMAEEADDFGRGLTPGQAPDLFAALVDLTWAISVRNFLGLGPGPARDAIRRGIESALDLLDHPEQLLFAIETPQKESFRADTREMSRLLLAHIAEQRALGCGQPSLLRALLDGSDDQGYRMGDEQIRDELVTMLRAGHKNTASVLTWALYLLARHPEAEARLLAELRAAPSLPAAPADLSATLPYTHAVISETMRLYPLYPIIGRTSRESTVLGGYAVPAGTSVVISSWLTQRSPRYFEAPVEFRPERWLAPQRRELPRFAYFPFGGGPRLCTVRPYALMEAVTLLAAIVPRWAVRPLAQRVRPLVSFNGLRPKGGLPARISPR